MNGEGFFDNFSRVYVSKFLSSLLSLTRKENLHPSNVAPHQGSLDTFDSTRKLCRSLNEQALKPKP